MNDAWLEDFGTVVLVSAVAVLVEGVLDFGVGCLSGADEEVHVLLGVFLAGVERQEGYEG